MSFIYNKMNVTDNSSSAYLIYKKFAQLYI